jgi:hypothetical protein
MDGAFALTVAAMRDTMIKGKRNKVRRSANRVPIPELEYITGVEEVHGAEDMSLDQEATMTPITGEGGNLDFAVPRYSLDYNQILSARDIARKKARVEHDEWLQHTGYFIGKTK